jgi:hypothetical protein
MNGLSQSCAVWMVRVSSFFGLMTGSYVFHSDGVIQLCHQIMNLLWLSGVFSFGKFPTSINLFRAWLTIFLSSIEKDTFHGKNRSTHVQEVIVLRRVHQLYLFCVLLISVGIGVTSVQTLTGGRMKEVQQGQRMNCALPVDFMGFLTCLIL